MSQALSRGMVVLVDLNPTRGAETNKVRPCVIVTNDVYNARVPVIQVVPITGWNEKKGRIRTNVTIHPTLQNGLTKVSIADCLQTRPIDHRKRLIEIKGNLTPADMADIDLALTFVFGLGS